MARLGRPADADSRETRLRILTVARTMFADRGYGTGEIDASGVARTDTLLRTITIGLVDAVSSDQTRHRRAVDAIIQLFEGKLVRPPA